MSLFLCRPSTDCPPEKCFIGFSFCTDPYMLLHMKWRVVPFVSFLAVSSRAFQSFAYLWKAPSILLINTELVYSAWPNFAECSERKRFINREEPLKISCRLSTLFSFFLIQMQGPWFMHVSEKKGTWNSLQIKQTVQKKEKQQSRHLLSN